MARIKVLIEGYARVRRGAMFASPTTTLIEDSNLRILVDPGANEGLLLQSLKKENLSVDDIDMIFLSHYHPDHFLNIRLFPKTPIYDGSIIWESDKETSYEGKIPGTDIKIIPTPGHADEHCSLLVKTDKGNVVVAADVFWWRDDEEQRTDAKSLISKGDDYANNLKKLRESRRKILEIADYIIPGHGKMFRVNK